MHTSKSLSLLAVALMQGLAAAAPHSPPVSFYPINGTAIATGTGTPATGTGSSYSVIFPSGTAPPSSYVPIGTGTGSYPSSFVPISASSSTISPVGTSLVDGYTTIFSTATQTKTLTYTVMVPCTTVASGSTSYYTTASVYTTWVSDVKTITITSPCTKCAYPTPTPAGPGAPGTGTVKPTPTPAGPGGPGAPGTGTIKPTASNPAGPGNPGAPGTGTIKPTASTPAGSACPGGVNCPPAGGSYTTTIQGTKTVIPVIVPSGQTTAAPIPGAPGVPTSPAGPAMGTTYPVGGSGGVCPAASTVTVYNPTTIYATVTVTPGAYTPTGGCKDGKCGTQTIAPTGQPSGTAPACPSGKCTTITTVVGCSSGKCTTITSVYTNTKTFTNWNGTSATATYKPTGTGFATGTGYATGLKTVTLH